MHAFLHFLATARRTWRAVVLASAVVAGACSSDGSSGPRSGPVGDYLLQQIASTSLPYDVHSGPYFDPADHHFYNRLIVRVTHGEVVLGRDDTFLFTVDVALNGDGILGQKHVEVTGTYQLQGGTLYFTPQTQGYPNFQAAYHSGAVSLQLDLMGKGTMLPYEFRR